MRESLRELDAAVRVQKTAEAEEELAQATLRRQYESNYFDARKALGRSLAERIFPKVARSQADTAEAIPAQAET